MNTLLLKARGFCYFTNPIRAITKIIQLQILAALNQ